jgi:hypothetical protein
MGCITLQRRLGTLVVLGVETARYKVYNSVWTFLGIAYFGSQRVVAFSLR